MMSPREKLRRHFHGPWGEGWIDYKGKQCNLYDQHDRRYLQLDVLFLLCYVNKVDGRTLDDLKILANSHIIDFCLLFNTHIAAPVVVVNQTLPEGLL